MTRLLASLQAAVSRAPGVLVAVTVLLTAVFAGVATQQQREAGFENFAPDNEITTALTTTRERFGNGAEATQLVVTSTTGPLLDADGVAAAAALRATLRDDPLVAAVLAPVPEGDAILTYADLVLASAAAEQRAATSLSDGEVAELQAAAVAALPPEAVERATSMLGGDGDGTTATVGAVVVLLDGEAEEAALDVGIRAVAEAGERLDGVEVSSLDFRVLAEDVNAEIEADLGRLLALAFGLIILILVAIYRRPTDVLASLFGLVFTITWMQGIATLLGPGFLGWTGGMSEMSTVIPILLVGLGVDYGIHLTMRYREERGNGADPAPAATAAIGAVGAALALATLTTAVGFLTNLFNPLPPLRDFGVFAAVGVAAAFLIMTTFVPAVRLLVDRWREGHGRALVRSSRPVGPSVLGRAASALAPAATHHPFVVLGVAGVLTVLGVGAATQLSTEFSQTEFFPEGSPALATLELAQSELGGDLTERTQLLVTGDITRPGVPAALHDLEMAAAALPAVRRGADGRAESDSVLRRLERSLPAVAAADGLPTGQRPDAAASLDGLLDPLLDADPTAAAVVAPPDALLVQLSTSTGEQVGALRDDLAAAAAPLRQLGLTVVVASDAILIDVVLDELRASQVRGLVITLVASMLILSVAFGLRVGRPVLGVLAIASVAVVVAWTLGLMAVLGIPFNVMTAMVSALAIGIGVPFGIHVVNRFLEDQHREDHLDDALRSTLQHTGGALIGSGLTTIAGFGSLMLSDVRPFQQFGAVTALTIGLALVASVVVLPAMLSAWVRLTGHALDGPDPTGPAGPAPSQPTEPAPVG